MSLELVKRAKCTKASPHKGNHRGWPAPKAQATLCGFGRLPVWGLAFIPIPLSQNRSKAVWLLVTDVLESAGAFIQVHAR